MHPALLSKVAAIAAVAVAASALPSPAAQRKTTFQQNYHASALMQQSYAVRLFASGNARESKPDAIVVTKSGVYIAYQNLTLPDGSDGGNSTIVQYRRDGTRVGSIELKGHCDGLRLNPYSGVLWAPVNNDANPALYTFETNLKGVKRYAFSAAPHGGGFDDLAFVDGKAFISASNPTLNGAGASTVPAVDSVTLSGTTAIITPVLAGNATAIDAITGAPVTLNEVDPDSMSVDPQGEVELVNQAGSELVFIGHPGTAAQTVRRLIVGTQLEDTIWASKKAGYLFVVDSKQNATYVVRADAFVPGTTYTIAPSDSGVASFLGTVDLTTGIITPVLLGFTSPTGLLFVPDEH
ncbi:MAG: hypothetical protein M3R53_05160 [Candidatus Eremiobacteraeota bacterium]|nr:hypothetical protein [Candidatus Eremiobacteraeota bacterium]